MLIRFTVNNYLSFKDETILSMIPGKGSKLKDHVVTPDKTTGISALKSAVIYGANASGKSNLIKAILSAKLMILNPVTRDQLLPFEYFRLDKDAINKPARFEFEIKANDIYYAYGFSFIASEIQEEWLYIIYKNNEKSVFERKGLETVINKSVIKDNDEMKRLEFMAEDLLPNQLFLNSVNNRNIDNMEYASSFKNVFNWFASSLNIILPDSRHNFNYFWQDKKHLADFFKEMLCSLDTGISDIAFKQITLEELEQKIYIQVLSDIQKKLKPGEAIFLNNNALSYNKYFIKKKENGDLEAYKMIFKHNTKSGSAEFEMDEESDGTNRLTDLLPILIESISGEKTFLIDEIDRSLHTELTYKFMQMFFLSDNDSQLIATTHDIGLLDLDLLRKDEVWFIEKNSEGASKLYSLEQFNTRQDLKIDKGYKNGRFGGIPVFSDDFDASFERFYH